MKKFNSLFITFLLLSLSLCNKLLKNVKKNNPLSFLCSFALIIIFFLKWTLSNNASKSEFFQRYQFVIKPKYSLYQNLAFQNENSMK